MKNSSGTRSGSGVKGLLFLSLFIVFSLYAGAQCPNLDIPVSPSPGDICFGDYGQVTLSNSEQDVFYRAYIDGNAVSGQVEGTGSDINIIIPAIQMNSGKNVVSVHAIPNPAASGNVAIFETSTPPVIDGIPDELNWYLVGDYPNENPVRPLPLSDTFFNAQWGAIYDTNYLYLAIRVQDYSLPVAPRTSDRFYHNDAVEFLLEGQDSAIKITVDCHNQSEQAPIPYTGSHYPTPHLHEAYIDSTNNVWSAEVRVAWADLGYAAPPGSMGFDTYVSFAQPPDSTGLGSKVWNSGSSFSNIDSVGTIETVPESTCDRIFTDTAIITAHGNPVVNAGSDTDICPSGDSLSSATGSDYNELLWTTSGDGTFDNDTILHPFYTPGTNDISSVSVTLTLSATGFGSCNNTSDDIILSVNPSPTANAGNDTSICTGDTIILTATGGTSYEWSTGDNSVSTVVSPAVTTNYTVTVTDANGCKDTNSVRVAILSLPAADAGNADSICKRDTITLTASGGDNYLWSNGDAAISTEVFPAIKTIYKVTVTDINGCQAIDSTEIFVHSLPLAEAGDPDTICLGDTVALTASGGVSFNWSNGASSATINISPVNTTSYTVTVTDTNGCNDTDSTRVLVYATPTADAGDPDTICEGGNISLMASGGDSYQWDGGPATQMYDVNNLDTTTMFRVTVINTNGCSDTDSVEITVNPLPNTSEISGEANPPCNASGVTYSVTSHPGAHYEWSVPVNGTIISDTSGPGHNNITVNFGNKNGNITVLETSAEGCTGPQKSLPVYMVGCDLDPAFDANDTSICFGDTVTFTNWSSGVTDTSIFEWDFGDGAIPATETDTGLATTEYKVFYSTTGQKTVSLRVYEGKIDTLNRDDYITVNSLPDANAGANVSICQGDTVELTANGGESYEWKNQPDVQTISINPADSTLYFVTVTDVNGCQDDDSVYVYVNPLPTVAGNDIDNLHYNSDTFLTINTGTGDYSYQWSPANMLLPANDTLSNPATVNLTGDQTYTVTVTNNQTGCYSIENIHVTVTGVPLSIIAGTDTAVDANVSICFGDQILLTAFSSGGTGNYTVKWDTVPLYDASLLSKKTEISVSPSETMTYVVEADDGTEISKDSITVFVNPLPVTSVWPEDTTVVSHAIVPLHAEGGTDYLWQPKEYLVDADTLQHPRAQPVVSTLYIVRVTNQYGCHSYDTIIVDTMACKLWVPEAFTPNGDQVNDVFKAEGFGIDGFNMILFNRWGEQIFESNSIDDGWDGTLNDNSQHTQSVGYIIKATCQDNKTIIEKKGNIYIVR